MKIVHRILAFVLFGLVPLMSACTKQNDSFQGEYGNSVSYFMALRSLQMGELDIAKRRLRSASKADNAIVRRKAKEELAALSDSVLEKIDSLTAIHYEYRDETSLLALCRQLFKSSEYAKIISETEDIDLETCSNEIAYYRISSLNEKKDTRLFKEYYKWCTVRPFERYQYNMYSQLEDISPDLLKTRAFFFTKNYTSAVDFTKKYLSSGSPLTPPIASDLGKILLYGSSSFKENAQFLESLAQTSSVDIVFYLYFYAGRLYDKTLDSKDKTISCFEKAMKSATSDSLFDNALWYYLQACLSSSPLFAVSAVNQYKNFWHDAYYFDDFFDTLSQKLLSSQNFDAYVRLAHDMDGYVSKETRAKLCYTAARILQENIIEQPDSFDSEYFLSLALDSETDLYYKFLALNEISLTKDEKENFLHNVFLSLRKKDGFEVDKDACQLLLGYADFGFAERIYGEWQNYKDKIDLETTKKISQFLFSCGKTQESYYTQAIRIASRKVNYMDMDSEGIMDSIYTLSYPKAFKDDIDKFCKTYNIEEYMMYALIRSESFFDSSVISSAGAIGLTQLMSLTAGDVAKKLKMSQFDLRDAGTNIQFGAYYLSEMIRRLYGSNILAVYAYNAGITRVRNWQKSINESVIKKNEKDYSLPMDLFLEFVPIAETREYGRKILSASVMYSILYSKDPDYISLIGNVIESVMNAPVVSTAQ